MVPRSRSPSTRISWTSYALISLNWAISVNAAPATTTLASSQGSSLSLSKVNLIKQSLDRVANKSWEMGTHTEALLEFDYPNLGVFFDSYVPVPSSPVATPVLAIASSALSQRPSSSVQQIMPDGSAADPASLGIAVILGNYTSPEGSSSRYSRAQYAQAAERQLQVLLQGTPRTEDGAISHRSETVSLWADFVYMVPPFLAYYGAVNQNTSLIQEAYDQCRLYRQYLRAPETGLWRHILWGDHPDAGLWATGNGWAAAGMLRVHATIVNSDYANDFQSQASDLADWATEIVEASFALRSQDGLLHNYLNETDSFTDAASTALMTSVAYRLAQLKLIDSSSSPISPTSDSVNQTRLGLYSRVNAQTGVLSPVVNPLDFGEAEPSGTPSPEGQAFILLLESAWRDWTLMSDQPGQGGAVDSQGNSVSGATTVFTTQAGLFASLFALFVAIVLC